MLLHFTIQYSTQFGEAISISLTGKQDEKLADIALAYHDGGSWQGSIATEYHADKIYYEALLKNENSDRRISLLRESVSLKKYQDASLNIVHDNIDVVIPRFTNSKPFKKVFHQHHIKEAKKRIVKDPTHIFKVNYSRLPENKFLCITGSAAALGAFDRSKPIIFRKKKKNGGVIKLDLSAENFPVDYKLAVYDAETKTIIEYETGPNRILNASCEKESITIIYRNVVFPAFQWKGAGVNVPLFSLRTQKDWGIGDLSALRLFTDFSAGAGLRLIQLLPINDTTAAHTDKDSYPYAAISAFATDPKYLDAGRTAKRYAVQISDAHKATIKKLNGLENVDHLKVLELKMTMLKEIFEVAQHQFTKEKNWHSFFQENKDWLLPYASFCCMRDKYKTADHAGWNEFAFYDKEKITAISSPGSELYLSILFWYFVQYELHRQLKAAVKYAHKKGIALKADLPIGVGRHSAETWQFPGLFHLNMQAGAPPDAFSESGQNWGFPTYNMEGMKSDNYRWFRRRMKHLQYYFDAVRIDHVPGFFRIWSIPIEYSAGTMGRFVPAKALTKNDFTDAGINVDEQRFCVSQNVHDPADVILFKENERYHFRINMQQTRSYSVLLQDEKNALDKLYEKYFYVLQNNLWKASGEEKLSMLKNAVQLMICAEDLGMVPDFTDEILRKLDILSLQVQQMPKKAGAQFSDTAAAEYGSVVMPATHDMPPIRLWWEQDHARSQQFFNEILKEEGSAPYFCETRICKKIIEMHLRSPALWSIFLLQDLFSTDGRLRREDPAEERINDPANSEQVWNYRLHIPLEKLIADKHFSRQIKEMIKHSKR